MRRKDINSSIIVFLAAGLMLFLHGCGGEDDRKPAEETLFNRLSPEQTNIDFSNTLSPGPGTNRNVLMYEYFYNGGGVAVGDLNGDDLEEIYFTGNMSYNKLYLNKGDMQFEDITEASGVAGRPNTWKSGVTMADVNGDGLLDIYVSYSGQLPPERRIDELYINQGPDENGIPQFKERAAEYGLDRPHSSNKAVFFDYDRDGDLDLFLLTHNVESLPVLGEEETLNMLQEDDPLNGFRLYRNDGERFVDVTSEAGINSSPLTYGLGAGVADINGDGWPDIYLCNDYSPPDYLYINNGDGTFTDKLGESMGHTSYASMGVDVADMNNDGLLDIFVLDMLPEDNRRQKLLHIPNDWDRFELNLDVGFHHQYLRNTLQLNNGNGTFSEIGQLAGISNTDWSWAPLAADFDNDGWKDLLVTNGYLHDSTNLDFIEYMNNYISSANSRLQREDVMRLLDELPSTDLTNYLFKNNGNLTYSDQTSEWGINSPSHSNGAAYADLDNDGDLDLITNNLNETASIFENRSDNQPGHHYLQAKLEGSGHNTFGIGTKLTLYTGREKQFLEQMPMRGYLSSVSPVLHFGLGESDRVDSLRVKWPDGTEKLITGIKADQRITLRQEDAAETDRGSDPDRSLFREMPSPIAFQHRIQDDPNDFKRQPLMDNAKSFNGPAMAKADVNGDGREDLFIGGGAGQPGRIYLQEENGKFEYQSQPAFEEDRESEDTEALFFDANGDGHPDLYVASGGYNDFDPIDSDLQDRLYLNNGNGSFVKSREALPQMYTSTGAVAVNDINGDGDPDLFIGGYVIPGRYPEIPRSYLLINNGEGRFQDRTSDWAPALERVGMVSSVAWSDLDGNDTKELVIAGQWMPIKVFENREGRLLDRSDDYFDRHYNGLWNTLHIRDITGNGRPDLVAGNFGLNSQLKATEEEPAELYYKDFDDNGTVDPILNFYIQGESYPFLKLDELTGQLPMMRSRFSSHESFSDATMEELFTDEELEGVEKLEARHMETSLFINDGEGKFQKKPLPPEAQFSPVFAIHNIDYNNDGHTDLLLAGNINQARILFGKYDANYGMLFRGSGEGDFTYIPQHESGFELWGDVRSILEINDTLLFGINQKEVRAYRFD